MTVFASFLKKSLKFLKSFKKIVIFIKILMKNWCVFLKKWKRCFWSFLYPGRTILIKNTIFGEKIWSKIDAVFWSKFLWKFIDFFDKNSCFFVNFDKIRVFYKNAGFDRNLLSLLTARYGSKWSKMIIFSQQTIKNTVFDQK